MKTLHWFDDLNITALERYRVPDGPAIIIVADLYLSMPNAVLLDAVAPYKNIRVRTLGVPELALLDAVYEDIEEAGK